MDVGRLRGGTQDTHNLYPQARLCQLVVSTTWFRKTRKASVHLTIHCPSATLSAMTRHAGQLNVSCHSDPLFLDRFDFCRNFWANILTCQGKNRLFSAKCTIPPGHPYLLRPFRGVPFHSMRFGVHLRLRAALRRTIWRARCRCAAKSRP